MFSINLYNNGYKEQDVKHILPKCTEERPFKKETEFYYEEDTCVSQLHNQFRLYNRKIDFCLPVYNFVEIVLFHLGVCVQLRRFN